VSWGPVIAIVAFIVVETIVGIAVVSAMVRNSIGEVAEKFPAQPVEADAVRRDFQSFKLGFVNLGWSVHVAADELPVPVLGVASVWDQAMQHPAG